MAHKGKIPSAEVVIRRFFLRRKTDVSGNSGVGVVAYGAVFPSGEIFMEWASLIKSHGHFHSIADLEKTHGHEGLTEIVFID